MEGEGVKAEEGSASAEREKDFVEKDPLEAEGSEETDLEEERMCRIGIRCIYSTPDADARILRTAFERMSNRLDRKTLVILSE